METTKLEDETKLNKNKLNGLKVHYIQGLAIHSSWLPTVILFLLRCDGCVCPAIWLDHCVEVGETNVLDSILLSGHALEGRFFLVGLHFCRQ